MTRRLHVSFAGLSCAAILASCGGPSAPELTDPREIVTSALTTTAAATSFHADLAADGTVSIVLPMFGGAPAPIDLTGTTASVDVDVQDTALRATFLAPGMFGLAGELISVGGTAYLKSTLTGTKYQLFVANTLPFDPTDPAGLVDNLGDLLLQDGIILVKGSDVPCGAQQCYSVTTSLTSAQLPGTSGPAASALPVDLTGAKLDLTLLVEQSLPHHLAGLEANLAMNATDSLKLDLTFSKWGEPLTIAPPPTDQIDSIDW
jgi:hypothetical protein